MSKNNDEEKKQEWWRELLQKTEPHQRVWLDVKFSVDVKEKQHVLVYSNEKNQTVQLSLSDDALEIRHKIIDSKSEKSLTQTYLDKAAKQVETLYNRLDESMKTTLNGIPYFSQRYSTLQDRPYRFEDVIEKNNYRIEYQWRQDNTLFIYPLWIIINNRILHPIAMDRLHESMLQRGKAFPNNPQPNAFNQCLYDFVCLDLKDQFKLNGNYFKSLYRGIVPYLMLSGIFNGNFHLYKNDVLYKKDRDIKINLSCFLAGPLFIYWRLKTSIEYAFQSQNTLLATVYRKELCDKSLPTFFFRGLIPIALGLSLQYSCIQLGGSLDRQLQKRHEQGYYKYTFFLLSSYIAHYLYVIGSHVQYSPYFKTDLIRTSTTNMWKTNIFLQMVDSNRATRGIVPPQAVGFVPSLIMYTAMFWPYLYTPAMQGKEE
ncbi:hypothetical protein FGO68_gene2903 [Halteria grandinella]|uniref:Uncharacterized protein n=1 Tax=Halteria grandinella TaxID=5974 RepID=A0A8J8NN71_HALGN|nr:hypothetical protein FGO68_gene2903 [Halteria grandinella]